MKKIIFLLTVFIVASVFAQKKTYYNMAINSCNEKSSENMINKCIIGSYLLNYDFKTVTDELVSTDKIKKPIVLIAASTRSAPCWGDIPAINKMVEKYSDKVEFLMIFRDDKKGIERMAKKLDGKVKLIPSTKQLENGFVESFGFIHKLDYPTTYLISKNKQFLNVRRGAAVPSKTMKWEAVTEKNVAELEAFLTPVL